MLRYSTPIAKSKEAAMLTVIADAMMIAARQRSEPMSRHRAPVPRQRAEERYKWRWLGLL